MEGSKLYGKAGYDEAKKSFVPDDISPMGGKVVAVTGANAGIGFATAMQMARLHAEVHLLCRSAQKCIEAKTKIVDATGNQNVHCHTCDVSLQHSVREFAPKFADSVPRLDILVNNAGCMPTQKTLTSEGHETIMATMLGGTMLLTDLLLPALRKSSDARVINVSSGGAYSVAPLVDDLDFATAAKYDGTLFYAVAKRHQIILSEEWTKRLVRKNIQVMVTSMHPGWAATEGLETAMKDFYDSNIKTLRTAAEGADTIVFLAANTCGKVSNNKTAPFWFDRNPVRTDLPMSGTSCSETQRVELWRNSAAYVGGLLFDNEECN